jgi:HK97 family phage portal protein
MFDFWMQRADGDVITPRTTLTLSDTFGLADRGRPSEQQVRQDVRGTLDACLRKRAELYAQSAVPDEQGGGYMVKRRTSDGLEPVEDDHPWLELLQRPNDYRSAYEHYYLQSLIRDVMGSMSMVLRDGPLGVPDAVLEVFPRFGRMQERLNAEGGVDGYVYHRADGEDVTLQADDVIQVKRLDPTSPSESTSILESLIYEATSDRAAAKYRTQSYKDGRPPMLYLSTEQDMTPENARSQGERFKNEYMSRAGDVKGVPVMYSGLEIQTLGLDPDSFQMLESQELDHQVIYRVTGVPGAYFDQGSNRAESEAARAHLMTGTIQPLLNQTAAQLTLALERAFDAEPNALQVVAPDVTPTNRQAEEEINKMRLQRGVTPAEIMRENGEEVPDEHEDDLDTPRLPSGLQPVGQAVGDFL